MKNLLIFVNPEKIFLKWYGPSCEIQIDNAFLMGWKKEDILLVTNFDYEYNGIKSLVVPDYLFCEHRRRASKINVIYYLLENKIIKDLCWFHDFDAHQLQSLDEIEAEIKGFDLAMTDYGYCVRPNSASFFFKPESKDIMGAAKYVYDKDKINEETAFDVLVRRNINNINERCKKLNITYSMGRKRQADYLISYERAIKPFKVVNINPRYPIFEGFKPFMSKELLDIFKRHGFN
jgi:hypothetical protein